MKIFGYIDDFMKIAYHWFDFIPNTTVQKIVYVGIILFLLWLLEKFLRSR